MEHDLERAVRLQRHVLTLHVLGLLQRNRAFRHLVEEVKRLDLWRYISDDDFTSVAGPSQEFFWLAWLVALAVDLVVAVDHHDVVATQVYIACLDFFLEKEKVAGCFDCHATLFVGDELMGLSGFHRQVSDTNSEEAFTVRLRAVSEVARKEMLFPFGKGYSVVTPELARSDDALAGLVISQLKVVSLHVLRSRFKLFKVLLLHHMPTLLLD